MEAVNLGMPGTAESRQKIGGFLSRKWISLQEEKLEILLHEAPSAKWPQPPLPPVVHHQ